MESVQRRANHKNESHHRPYEKNHERLGLTYFKTTQERNYFIQIYKITLGQGKVNMCDWNKILRPGQNKKGQRHHFQLSPEQTFGNEQRTHFFHKRMATPLKNLPKDSALARLLNSFKSKKDFYINKLGRNRRIWSQRTAIDEADDHISWQLISTIYAHYFN